MSPPLIEIEGTLQADGTLVLDEKPNLPPGRVRVTVQPAFDPTQTEIWQFFQQLWASQQADGRRMRTAEEIDADIAHRQREEDEEEADIERIRQECAVNRQRHNEGGTQ